MRFTRYEIVVITLLVIAGLLSYLTGFDQAVEEYMGSGYSIEFSLFFSYTYYFIYMASVTVILWIKDKRALAAFFLTIIAITLIHWTFTVFMPRPRPLQAHSAGELLDQLNDSGYASSFPSSHAAIAVSGYTLLCETGIRRWYAFIAAIPIIIARIMMVHHYISDMIAGIILGYVISKIFYNLLKKYDFKTEKRIKNDK